MKNGGDDFDRMQIAMILDESMISKGENTAISVNEAMETEADSDFRKSIKLIEVHGEFSDEKLRSILEHEQTLANALKRIKFN